MRPLIVLTATALAALSFSACQEGIDVPADDPHYEGAVLFAERCAGCHTLAVAGAQGSGDRTLRPQGPNLDEREEAFEDVMWAIQNGGFGGAIMPQNIVVGQDAVDVACFIEEYSGTKIDQAAEPPAAERPEPERPAAEGEGEGEQCGYGSG